MGVPIPSRQLLQGKDGSQLTSDVALTSFIAFSARPCLGIAPGRRQQRCLSRYARLLADEEQKTVDVEELKRIGRTAAQKGGKDPEYKSGKLGPSIFDEAGERHAKVRVSAQQAEADAQARLRRVRQKEWSKWRKENWRQLKATSKDPKPKARVRWQRKIVIRDVRGRGRLNKEEKLMRTERSHTLKSPDIKGSIKKLGPLARQIAGKTVEDALTQMRFSKKKAAVDVMRHLKYVRDQAIVAKGMGSGDEIPGVPLTQDQSGKGPKFKTVILRDKQGKKRTITNPNDMYIEQAWVGRGTPDYGTDHRARGRAFRLTLPFTSECAGPIQVM